MGITTTSRPRSPQRGLSTKTKCWDCGANAPAFLIESHSGNAICGDCASEKGERMPVTPSEDPIGTIQKGKKRGH